MIFVYIDKTEKSVNVVSADTVTLDRSPLNYFKEVNALKNDSKYNLPADALEALARTLYPAMLAYFESEEGKQEFAEWQAQQGRANTPLGEVKSGRDIGQAA